ncbi:MAG: histone deacetylase [Verrucomicrobiota bacterium]
MLPLWYSPIYTDGLHPDARFPRDRYRLVREGLENHPEIAFHEPDELPMEFFQLAHCPRYVERFFSQRLDEREVRRIGLKPWTDQIERRTRILTNGTVEATRHVLSNGGFAANMGGGTHHAYYDFGSGYCIFNDLAISARMAQRDFGVDRVLILDLDVHQGDGTAAIFENDSTVRTVSFHCAENFPFRKMESDLDIALTKGTSDHEYLQALDHFLTREAIPDLLLFQAGVDGLSTDRLGHLELSPEGMKHRNQVIFDFAAEHEIPTVTTMGGGYGEPISTSVAAHVTLFEQAAEFP